MRTTHLLSNRITLAAATLALATALAAGPALAQDDTAARTEAAKQAVMGFAKELGGALKAELDAGGPVQAISVCRDIAPAIANRLSLANGWRVTRVGTRVRNPMLGTPDAWEQQVLQDFQARAEQGESYADMLHTAVVDEPGGRYFRFMKPIPVQALCLNCHGSEQDLSAPVKSALDQYYPHDRAIGYQTGELRGAFSIKQPMN